MAIAMVAMLAFGGTYAYFTATATAQTGSVKTAVIKLTSGGDKVAVTGTTANILPGESFTSTTTLTNGSNRKIYAFIQITTVSDVTISTTAPDGWTAYTTDTSYENIYVATLDTTDTTKVAAVTVTFSSENSANWAEGSDQPALMGADIGITVKAVGVQAEGDASYTQDTAWNAVKTSFTAKA